MKRYRLSAGGRAALRAMGDEVISLRYDKPRRFVNALRAIACSDPQWMIWVERNLPKHIDELQRKFDTYLMLVEGYARWRILSGYRFLFREQIGFLIFRDWPISDDGALTPG
jgi:hypothetical protein